MNFRTVEQEIWKHPVMRQGSEHARQLYFYLVTGTSDCEGRFVADALDLLEGCWSRRHQVGEQDVEEALQELLGLSVILLYQDGRRRYGFLCGWYEHQRVDAKYRDGSSLPAPPILLCSWARLDQVRTFYADYADLGGTNVSRKAAIAWFNDLPIEERERFLPPLSPAQVPLLAIQPECAESAHKVEQEGIGRDRKGREQDVPAPVPSAWSDFLCEMQDLWPTGIPDGFQMGVRSEFDATDPDVALAAGRATVRHFARGKYEWPQVQAYVCATMRRMAKEDRPTPDASDPPLTALQEAQNAQIARDLGLEVPKQ